MKDTHVIFIMLTSGQGKQLVSRTGRQTDIDTDRDKERKREDDRGRQTHRLADGDRHAERRGMAHNTRGRQT